MMRAGVRPVTKNIKKPNQAKSYKEATTSKQKQTKPKPLKNKKKTSKAQKKAQETQIYTLKQLPKFIRPPKEYIFLEAPIVVPSQEELIHPFKLVKRLHDEGYMKHGVVKIVPDKSMWNPQYVFNRHQKLMTSRTQVINDLPRGKPYDQNVDEYTYEEFKEVAEDFQNNYEYQTQVGLENKYRKNEFEYWSIVENPEKFKEVEVEYAADLPSSKYGSAFADLGQLKNTEKGWNLTNINGQKNSLFQFTKEQKNTSLSGITTPWVYLGMQFATFCFHTEDLWMYALNYMHFGEKKTWYTIPPQFKNKFEEVYKAKYFEIFQKKPDILYLQNLQLSPLEAASAYVPVYRTDQGPGEFIMTFPKVYHGGFSHGFNCGEAVNIATTEWLKYYREAVDDYALKGHHKKVSFPIQWLLQQIIEYLDKSEFNLQDLINIFGE
ncbi:hypothetical protein PPERSA_12094 [Pseudocohnilembus persalinus]|uniref:JmjC domain n=1 Tax=Pseudocohnilembus persalinus TaxID=266149 RepID=A0A0V0R9J5_PSEPJ|nr:hypothetical protein PPERSA_12094 [Pseudocohnilembus persalinus]|eukprot:KRX10970.1 hypothetical protein PPERSA_12094 [Pseudocohnilembus persalinus]